MSKLIETRSNGRKRVATVNNEKSRTAQQHKDACDINVIMRKFIKTGNLNHVTNVKTGKYLDLLEVPSSYQECLDIVVNHNKTFMQLPSALRIKFNNNPDELVKYLQNPANKEESIKLGLRQPDPKVHKNPTETPVEPQNK